MIIPVVAALLGAAVYGVTGVLQQRAAHQVAGTPTDQAGFARGLIRQPLWVLSTIGSVVGFGLQGVALGTGPIVLVQPLLVTGVLFAAVTGFAVRRRRVDWPFFGALLLTVAGLAAFLVVARPAQGTGSPSLDRILPLGIALAVIVVACVAWSLRAAGLARSMVLALAAGVVYGATAAVAKLTIAAFGGGGFVAGVTHWSTWALVVLGPLGFLLNQNAFREGELASPAVAIITVTDPLVGIGIGTLWLGEGLAAGPGAITGEVLALAAMTAGVWFVAHRAPQLTAGSRDVAGERRGPVGTRAAPTT